MTFRESPLLESFLNISLDNTHPYNPSFLINVCNELRNESLARFTNYETLGLQLFSHIIILFYMWRTIQFLSVFSRIYKRTKYIVRFLIYDLWKHTIITPFSPSTFRLVINIPILHYRNRDSEITCTRFQSAVNNDGIFNRGYMTQE